MTKKIKANDIKNLSKKIFAYKKIIAVAIDGTEFEVLIQEKLNETSIADLLTEYIDRSNYCTKNKLKFDELYNIYYLIFKYFTDIDFSIYKSTKKQYEEDLNTIKNLRDIGLYEQILNHFDVESINKIQEALTIYAKQLNIVSNNKMREIIEEEKQAEEESDDNAIV